MGVRRLSCLVEIPLPSWLHRSERTARASKDSSATNIGKCGNQPAMPNVRGSTGNWGNVLFSGRSSGNMWNGRTGLRVYGLHVSCSRRFHEATNEGSPADASNARHRRPLRVLAVTRYSPASSKPVSLSLASPSSCFGTGVVESCIYLRCADVNTSEARTGPGDGVLSSKARHSPGSGSIQLRLTWLGRLVSASTRGSHSMVTFANRRVRHVRLHHPPTVI